jgi:alpha(1,3/1,4) fucosyltransferase
VRKHSMPKPIKLYALNFWPGFSLEFGFVHYLFTRALGAFEIAKTEKEADVVLVSLFPRFQRLRGLLPSLVRDAPETPERSIGILWENQRPDYGKYAYSISSDFDSYGGRNIRVPFWYSQIQWPDMLADKPHHRAWSGFEPLVSLDALTKPRVSSSCKEREQFCCFVAANREPHRLLTINALSRISQVDLYGPISGRAFKGSKYDLLRTYRFNLCFENSIFPGYYTEKMLQAWVGGCVPLYYSDPWYSVDFNPKAAINRIHSRSLDEFVERVATVSRSPDAFEEMFRQPLLTEEPRLDDAVEFLGKACTTILEKRT